MPDPPIPADGRCAECHGERKMPASKLHRAVSMLDPFCSSECARAFYGVQLVTSKYAQSGAWKLRDDARGNRNGARGGSLCGTESGYAAGCRCDGCREASAKAKARRRAAAKS